MEEKLKEYRALRRRKEMMDNAKEQLAKSKDKLVNLLVPKMFTDMGEETEEVPLLDDEESPPEKPSGILIQPEDPDEVDPESDHERPRDSDPEKSLSYLILKWFICLLIWFAFYFYFLYIQFGAVYFVISILVGICYNTRTRPKRKGELSAYSVFNNDCASIGGTLKAEQLQREMMLSNTGLGLF